jgi:hypothetical protein
MKNLLFIIALIALSSCGKIKKITQTNDTYSKDKVEMETSEAITIKETIDTTVILKPIDIDVTNNLIDLIDTSKIVIDTDELEVKLSVDKSTKKVKTSARIKQRIIPIQKTKETYIERSSEVDLVQIKKDNSERKEVEKPKAATSFTWWLIIALIAAGGFLFLRFMPFRITRL